MFYCMGQCVSMPRLLWRTLMVMKADCRLHCVCVCIVASVHLGVVLTLARWQGATPGAVVGAGPCDSVVTSHHHVPRLTRERHIVAHGEVIAAS